MTAAWHATTTDELHAVEGWVHDAHFAWERIKFDDAAGAVIVPFEQEPTTEEECGQPGQQLVARGRLGSSIYRVPFVRCRLRVRQAQACVLAEQERDAPGMLDGIDYDPAQSSVHVATVVGPHITVPVDGLDIEIQMTDELAFYVRRVEVGGAHSDTRWPTASA